MSLFSETSRISELPEASTRKNFRSLFSIFAKTIRHVVIIDVFSIINRTRIINENRTRIIIDTCFPLLSLMLDFLLLPGSRLHIKFSDHHRVVILCIKNQLFWEGHKILVQSPSRFWRNYIMPKPWGRLRRIFVAFSEKLNFTRWFLSRITQNRLNFFLK